MRAVHGARRAAPARRVRAWLPRRADRPRPAPAARRAGRHDPRGSSAALHRRARRPARPAGVLRQPDAAAGAAAVARRRRDPRRGEHGALVSRRAPAVHPSRLAVAVRRRPARRHAAGVRDHGADAAGRRQRGDRLDPGLAGQPSDPRARRGAARTVRIAGRPARLGPDDRLAGGALRLAQYLDPDPPAALHHVPPDLVPRLGRLPASPFGEHLAARAAAGARRAHAHVPGRGRIGGPARGARAAAPSAGVDDRADAAGPAATRGHRGADR